MVDDLHHGVLLEHAHDGLHEDAEEADQLGALLRIVHDGERELHEARLQAQHVVQAGHGERAVVDEERARQLHAVVGGQLGLARILGRYDVEVGRQLLEDVEQLVEATRLLEVRLVLGARDVAEQAEHGRQHRLHDDAHLGRVDQRAKRIVHIAAAAA